MLIYVDVFYARLLFLIKECTYFILLISLQRLSLFHWHTRALSDNSESHTSDKPDTALGNVS